MIRYPLPVQNYHSEKKASELRDQLRSWPEHQRSYFESKWTTIPREYVTEQDEHLRLTIKRDRSSIYIGNFDEPAGREPSHKMSRISDVAYRHEVSAGKRKRRAAPHRDLRVQSSVVLQNREHEHPFARSRIGVVQLRRVARRRAPACS